MPHDMPFLVQFIKEKPVELHVSEKDDAELSLSLCLLSSSDYHLLICFFPISDIPTSPLNSI